MQRLTTRLGAFLAMLAMAANVNAAPFSVFEYTTNLSVNNQVSEDKVQSAVADPSLVPLDTTLSEPAGSARARAYVGYGVNKALTQLNAPDAANPMWLGYTLATSTWRDVVTISDPNLDGSLGSFKTTMLVNGSGHFAPSASWLASSGVSVFAQWLATIDVIDDRLGLQRDGWFGAWVKDPGTGDTVYVGAPLNAFQVEATFSFVFGEPFLLGGVLQTYISLDNFALESGTLDATLDLGNSAYWGGMSLFDAQGNPVNAARLVSDSGVDWRLAIGAAALPEPGTLPLLAASLIMLALVAVRRRHVP